MVTIYTSFITPYLTSYQTQWYLWFLEQLEHLLLLRRRRYPTGKWIVSPANDFLPSWSRIANSKIHWPRTGLVLLSVSTEADAHLLLRNQRITSSHWVMDAGMVVDSVHRWCRFGYMCMGWLYFSEWCRLPTTTNHWSLPRPDYGHQQDLLPPFQTGWYQSHNY